MGKGPPREIRPTGASKEKLCDMTVETERAGGTYIALTLLLNPFRKPFVFLLQCHFQCLPFPQ